MAKQQKYLVGFFTMILVGFFVLMAQDLFHFSKVRKLQGDFTPKVQPQLTINNWFSGSYQDSLGEYINENIGFRNFFVRLNNQLAFSLFDFARANGVVVGKENYLYERNYIEAHLGEDYIGEELILEKVEQLVKAQEQLKQKGIDLIIVFAPGKGSFFPEFFPKEERQKTKSVSNYETFSKSIKETPLNFIDFNHWFRDLKGKTAAPLYPKTGIHWSRFGELMAADSLLRYIEKLKDIQLPEYNFTDTVFTKDLAYTDDVRKVSEVNMLEELEKHETVILLSTDANLYRFPFGFIDNMGLALKRAVEDEKEARIQRQMSIIKASEEWYEDIKGYAKTSNITIKKALRDNAEYMIWLEDNER